MNSFVYTGRTEQTIAAHASVREIRQKRGPGMDDRRFDALVKSLAGGTSRRALLERMLGIGWAVVASEAFRSSDAAAARRPKTTPTPAAIICPGSQVPCGNACCCPNGGDVKCGPDCCPAGIAECCDNACCYGTCYGEEVCCPSERDWCAATGECCPPGRRCCAELGCLDLGPDRCCFDTDCPPNATCVDFGCVCNPGFVLCDGVCVLGNCCDATTCLSGSVCNQHTCCQPRTCADTLPDSLEGCGGSEDGCGGTLNCRCPEGWECIVPNGFYSWCQNHTTTCIPGLNLCTLDFATALQFGTCNGGTTSFCYDDLAGGAVCAVDVQCQECHVDSDCIYDGWRCIRTCDWQGCPGNTACASTL